MSNTSPTATVVPPAVAVRDTIRPIIAVTYSSKEFGDPVASVPWQLAFRAVVAAGGVPLAIDCSAPNQSVKEAIGLADGLILFGGVDVAPELYGADPLDPSVEIVDRVRDENELAALRAAATLRLPTLAICRGLQLVNVARGGTLSVDLKRDVPNAGSHRPAAEDLVRSHHDVYVERSSQIAKWMTRWGRLAVNSYHHQGISEVGDQLRVTARADDGLVEAVETLDGLVVAIQWHPEYLWPADPNARALLAGFVSSCATMHIESGEEHNE